MALEVPNSYSSQVDNGSDLTIDSTSVSFDTMAQNVVDYVADDKGSGHFSGDFNFESEFIVTAATASDSRVFYHSLSNNLGALSAQTHSLLALVTGASATPTIADIDDAGATDMSSTGSALSLNTRYYDIFKRVGNTLTWEIYTNSGRTALDQSVSGTIVNTSYTYQYFYAMSSRADSGAATISGDIQNIDLQEVADTNVLANTDALTLTENQATVNAEINVQAAVDALVLTEYQSTISLGININAATDALTLSEQQASINAETNIQATTDALTLTEYIATINSATTVQTNVDALSLTTYQSTVSLVTGTNVLANTDALVLTEQQASINAAINILASTDLLVLTGLQASIGLDVGVQIDKAGSYIINTNLGSVTMYFNGEEYFTI